MPIEFGKTVHPLPFSELSGRDFERLVFAFLWRRWPWRQLDWYGQLGDDGGRDIVGVREDDRGRDQLVVVACANWRKLTTKKAAEDIDKIARDGRPPDQLIVMSGSMVSAALRAKVIAHAGARGLHRTEVWSGPELEEQLRLHAGSVLRRFFAGDELPDTPDELREFVLGSPSTDQEALAMLARLFDRPAFCTPFHTESSLPAFRRALSDTIEALNTGLYRNRDGVIIARLPARHDFATSDIREALTSIVHRVMELRIAFDEGLRTSTIRPCGCRQPDCPVFMVEPETAKELNERRGQVLSMACQIIPNFQDKQRS